MLFLSAEPFGVATRFEIELNLLVLRKLVLLYVKTARFLDTLLVILLDIDLLILCLGELNDHFRGYLACH